MRTKSHKEIQGEIQAIIRQITASVTYLPLLEEPCTFDLLVYTDDDAAVPKAWEESDPRYITDSEEVRLRTFTTTIHKVSGGRSGVGMLDGGGRPGTRVVRHKAVTAPLLLSCQRVGGWVQVAPTVSYRVAAGDV